MSLQTYWLIVAPGLLFGLSLVGWLALWVTRPSAVIQQGSLSERATDGPHLRGWRLAVVVAPVAVTALVLALAIPFIRM
jgi:hypothetical protein